MSTEVCFARQDDGSPCGGQFAGAFRGRHTAQWFQTCTRCGMTVPTAAPAPEGPDRGEGLDRLETTRRTG